MTEIDKIRTQLQACVQSRELLPHWQTSLLGPLEDFFARPRKDFRSKMIALGYDLGTAAAPAGKDSFSAANLSVLQQLLEALHSGSLIVDDIQDSSEVRRGDATLHLKYGLPVALNAGNWLYFLAYKLIEQLEVPQELKLKFYGAITETLFSAHLGQALDVGIAIDQMPASEQVKLCQKSLELKSGLLMGLAVELGALLSPAEPQQIQKIRQFGIDFGICLQRFDDLGNLNTDCPTPKHLEDLKLRRPSWIWQSLAELGTSEEQKEFSKAVNSLPDIEDLKNFLVKYDFKQRSFNQASKYLQDVINQLPTSLEIANDHLTLVEIQKLGEKLTYAYNK